MRDRVSTRCGFGLVRGFCLLAGWFAAVVVASAAAPPPAAGPREARARHLARLFDALDTADRAAAYGAYEALQLFVGKDDLDGVARAALDRRVRVRKRAILLLWNYRGHSPAETPYVHRILLANLRHKDAGVRLSAANVAAGFAGESPQLLRALVAALEDHAIAYSSGDPVIHDRVSDYAGLSLNELGAKTAAVLPTLLEAAVSNKRWEARASALSAIAKVAAADEGRRAALLGFLIRRMEEAPDWHDRRAAAVTLRALGPHAAPAVPALRRLYRCERLKRPEECAAIQMAVLETYPEVGPAAASALPDLLPVLRDKAAPEQLRLQITEFARRLRGDGKAAWPALRRIAADDSEPFVLARQVREALDEVDPTK